MKINEAPNLLSDLYVQGHTEPNCDDTEFIRDLCCEAHDEIMRLREYAVPIEERARKLVAFANAMPPGEPPEAFWDAVDELDAALAKNPNPAGHLERTPEASVSLSAGASGSAGLGPDVCLEIRKFERNPVLERAYDDWALDRYGPTRLEESEFDGDDMAAAFAAGNAFTLPEEPKLEAVADPLGDYVAELEHRLLWADAYLRDVGASDPGYAIKAVRDGIQETLGERPEGLPEVVHQVFRSKGVEDIAAERERQVRVEGWHEGHDDDHDSGQIAAAAACYAFIAAEQAGSIAPGSAPLIYWPWDAKWWKPRDARRNLVRAGALIAAEIDRIDRAEHVRHAISTSKP